MVRSPKGEDKRAVHAMEGPDDALEFHIFLDPTAQETPAEVRLRCHAALTAICGRFAPRLEGCVWHREPFELWLWDPERDTARAPLLAAGKAEMHLWGRMSFGESIDDEWFAVGLLLQLSVEQRDASITVRDTDGELLLIEAAYCLPRWLTPEIALNRVFLRHGEVKLVPKAVAPLTPLEPLHLSHALPALRADTPALRCAAVTAAVRARFKPLLLARGPPRHRARCLLPEPLAQLLAADPALAAAAAHAFCERDGDDMKRASRARRFAPHGRAVVAASVSLSLCMYSKVRQARFLPPPGTSLAPPDASAAQRRAARHCQSAGALGGVRGRLLRLLRARLMALASSTLPTPDHGAPSHRLGCSSWPPPKSPIPLRLTIQAAELGEKLSFGCTLPAPLGDVGEQQWRSHSVQLGPPGCPNIGLRWILNQVSTPFPAGSWLAVG